MGTDLFLLTPSIFRALSQCRVKVKYEEWLSLSGTYI